MSKQSRISGLVSSGFDKDLPALRKNSFQGDMIQDLKNENLQLKKQINSQDDKTKKLLTKVQKLSEDLRRTQNAVQPAANKPNPTGELKGREAVETYAMMDEMRSQLQQVTKQNNTLRNKVQFFKSLHEAEVRKRAPYDHIPPRVNTGVQRKLYPALNVKTRGHKIDDREADQLEQEHYEEIQKLEELVAALREKLIEAESEANIARSNYDKLRHDHEEIQRQQDIDRLTLQKELVEKNKRIQTMSKNYDSLDDKYRILNEAHSKALASVESLNGQLKEERLKLVDLEAMEKTVRNEKDKNKELSEMFEDLKAEKEMIEHEYNTLLNNQFSKDREKQFLEEVDILKMGHSDLQREVANLMEDKQELLNKLKDLNDNLRRAQDEKQKSDSRLIELQHEYEQLEEKLKAFTQDGTVNLDELEEALAIVRLRRQKGVPLDFLVHVDDLVEASGDKRLLQELRIQHAECVQELEKVHKLLMLQEKINRDYKGEVEDLNRKIDAMKNEYELRLEEDSRLLDLRSNKIANLEAQLRDLVYSTVKVPDQVTHLADSEDMIELEHGQNLFEVHLEGAIISDTGIQLLKRLGYESCFEYENEITGFLNNFTTFIHFDFYEFETKVSPLGVGLKPHYNFTSKYRVIVDDFFLQYLQSQAMTLNICRSNGLDFYNFGFCHVRFKELMETDKKTTAIQFYADIISTHDQKTIIGKIDYSLRMRIPMAQSIKAFKERIVALNLLTVGQDASSKRFLNRAEMNELVVHVKGCTGLVAPISSSPSAFCSFDFYQYDDMVTETAVGTTSPVFNFMKMLPVPMTSDLDRYLRTSHMYLIVADEGLVGDRDYVYGIAKIPLISLVFNEGIDGTFELKDEFGFKRGSVQLSLQWSKPYKVDIVPLVSSLVETTSPHTEPIKKALKTSAVPKGPDSSVVSRNRNMPVKHPDAETVPEIKSSQQKEQRSLGEVSAKSSLSDHMLNEDSSSLPSSTTTDNTGGNIRKQRYVPRELKDSKRNHEGSSDSFVSGRPKKKPARRESISTESMTSKRQEKRPSVNKETAPSKHSSHPSESSDSQEEYQDTAESLHHSEPTSTFKTQDDSSVITEQTTLSSVSKTLSTSTSLRPLKSSRESAESIASTPSQQGNRKSKKTTSESESAHSDGKVVSKKSSRQNSTQEIETSEEPANSSSRMKSSRSSSVRLSAQNVQSSVKSHDETTSEPALTETASIEDSPSQTTSKSIEPSLASSPSAPSVSEPSASLAGEKSRTTSRRASTAPKASSEIDIIKVAASKPLPSSFSELHQDAQEQMTKETRAATQEPLLSNLQKALSPHTSRPSITIEMSESEDAKSTSIEKSSQQAHDESVSEVSFTDAPSAPVPQTTTKEETSVLSIKIDQVTFDITKPQVAEHLNGVRQVFIGYDFLDCPPEQLESPSSFMNPNGKLAFDFKRDFPLNTPSRSLELLSAMLHSEDPVDSVVVFTIVSEPPEDASRGSDAECVDVAVAELHLKDLLQTTNEKAVSIPVWDLEGELLLGKMELYITGCSHLNTI